MKKLRIAYFGSSDFSADLLEKIILDKNLPVEIKLVVTQPDQLAGRKQVLTPTPVKQIANKYKIIIHEPKFEARNSKSETNSNVLNFKNSNLDIVSNFDILISNLKDVDLVLVYAFGELIPKELLNIPKQGFWNIHPSLLPKYRGPSPIASALINGDKTTGVTIIKMDEEIDHGPIITQQSLDIKKTDKRPDLEKNLTNLAFEMFSKIVIRLTGSPSESEGSRVNGLIFKPQNHSLATYTKKLTKKAGFIEIKNFKFQISNSPEKLFNLFRGLYPWPGIWTMVKLTPSQLNEKRLKITDVEFINGKLTISRVQLEGKNEVDFETFNEAYRIF